MKRHAAIILVCVCAAIFVLGIVELFQLRFERGDVYPPYSSLRADLLGAMAFFESLERMPGLTVRRDFSANNQLPEARGTTYLHLAAEPGEWRWMSEDLVKEIEGFLTRGGRLVITFEPETTGASLFAYHPPKSKETNAPAGKEKTETKKSSPGKPGKPGKPRKPIDTDEEDFFAKEIDLQERWGFGIGYEKLPLGEGRTAESVEVTNRSGLALPAALAWHSATLFTNLAPTWQIIYARETNAVVLERRFGSGSLVLASDSFFVSNEALLTDRHASLLGWLVGTNNSVVFDEAHLGVVEQPGVATLMRQYRLHGLAAGLALLMGLFVWKNAFSLVPPPRHPVGPAMVAGRDSALGFVNLLRRSIPTGDILKVCYDEWRKTSAGRRDLVASRITQAEQTVESELALPKRDQNPVVAYQQAARILKSSGPVAISNPAKEERS